MACAKQIERASQKAFKDDLDVYTVLIGSQHDADASVKDITVENFSVTARSKELFKNASLKISHGKRYGLVGPNGTGKSSLLKVLAWRKIHVPENIDVLLVDKETVCDDRTVLEAVVSANDELVKLRMRSDVAEAQALKILGGLGFTKAMQTWATRLFNSEWRMRISLARALFVEPALLLLDEPTGYLDLRAVLWLEEYLRLWRNTLVVASHDRDFLNTVCNGIIHPNDFKLHMYDGNFKDFESVYERRHKETDKKIETYDKQVKATKPTDYTVGFHFPEPTEFTPSPLLKFIGVSFIHSEREEFSLPDVDVTIDMGTRVAIVGPNGVGKSTLLNLLAGSLNPTKGEVRRSQMLRIERYSQHFVDHLLTDETPVKYLLRLHPDKEGIGRKEAVHAKLVKFGLPSHNHRTPLNRLSSRQKTRVVFTSISMSKPHILLLDEPTNHLDMQSIDALADALDEFSGGVVLVSHDSRLISRVCDDEEKRQIWVVENGRVEEFDGTFEDYKQKLLKEIRSEVDD